MKPYVQILESIDKEFAQAIDELRSDILFSSTQTLYTDEEKRRIKYRWMRIVRPFRALRSLIRGAYWRSFIFRGNTSIFVIRYAATITYYNMMYELQKSFGPHEEFIRQYLDDTFSENYTTLARYMYHVRFYTTILYPHEYFLLLEGSVHPSLVPLFSRPDRSAGDIEKRFTHDMINIWYHLRYGIARIATWLSKYGGNIMALIHLTRRKHGLITPENIDTLSSLLEPGDILLTRHNWVATNLGIPGFWKHMSMYVGTGRLLRETYHMVTLGVISDDEHYIIEAIGTGVRLIPLSLLAGQNDYLGAVRPRFSHEKKSRAIKKLLSLLGEAYDYSFNFYSDVNYVCSTLVTKSYLRETASDEGIHITLVRIGTSITYPPNDLVKKLRSEKKNPELDFVAFLDATEKGGNSFFASENAFLASGDRSRLSFFLE